MIDQVLRRYDGIIDSRHSRLEATMHDSASRPESLWKRLERAHIYGLCAVYLYGVVRFIVAFILTFNGAIFGALLVVFFNLILPPLLALDAAKSPTSSPSARALGNSFLTLLGLGIVIAPHPQLFPGLNGMPQAGLPVAQVRMLFWAMGVYILYLFGILPPYVFGKSLRQHRRGEPAEYSRFTCVLGLFTWALIVVAALGNLAIALGLLG